MLKRNLPGGKSRIPYLIRRAFAEAEEGDRDSAMAYWNQAISEGYEPKVKTKRQLMYKIRDAELKNKVEPENTTYASGIRHGDVPNNRSNDDAKEDDSADA